MARTAAGSGIRIEYGLIAAGIAVAIIAAVKSIFDGGKLIGDVTAAADGTWNFQTNVTGSGVHTYTETSLDSSGFTATSTGVTLYSPSGSQTLQGGSGNDVLIGAPHDILMGNAGSDTFVFNTSLGKETVADFNVNQDELAFDHTLFTHDTAVQVLSQTHDSSAGAVIVIDPHDTVTLTGVTVAQLQAAQTAGWGRRPGPLKRALPPYCHVHRL